MKPVISPFLVVATLLVSGVAAKAWQDAPSAIRQLFESVDGIRRSLAAPRPRQCSSLKTRTSSRKPT